MAWPWRRKSRRKLARIAIEGPIAGPTRERVLKALREVEQRECPALLLRIDSPGGTVGDSQEIHAAITRLRSKGCKVVASFGNISASGGVYVGVAAEQIVANPGTITGSIGVFAVLPTPTAVALNVTVTTPVVSPMSTLVTNLLLAPVLEAALWPVASVVLLAPQRRAPDPDENRPL